MAQSFFLPNVSSKVENGNGSREGSSFYVVKKRDIVGVYKCLNDCQALLGSSVCDPSVSVFKGYGLPKEAEDYLVSNGLKNAVYSVAATAVQDHLFGQLSVCPFQEPSSSKRKALDQFIPNKRLQLQHKAVVPTSIPITPQNKHVDFQKCVYIPSVFCSAVFCNLEFDGASRGNPGQSGAGAVLRIEVERGTRVYRLREGVGFATNSVAEYRGLLLGLKYALQKGYKYIGVQGDSQLVVTQVQGLLRVKQNMADLYNMVKELKDKFSSFEIRHVERDLNSAADVQAKLAIDLKGGMRDNIVQRLDRKNGSDTSRLFCGQEL